MPNIYKAVYEATKDYDVSTYYNVSGVDSGWNHVYPDWELNSKIFSLRLGHSHDRRFPNLGCTEFTADNEVECYYLFGETLLIGHHKVGQCPWKLL
jgi:hypothetical protein